jgi:hypothetical protein
MSIETTWEIANSFWYDDVISDKARCNMCKSELANGQDIRPDSC